MDNILRLECHPESPAKIVEAIEVSASLLPNGRICLRYNVICEFEKLETGFPVKSVRADGLWKTTCFELFVLGKDGQSYIELNFAPSSMWAAYQFSSYREDMQLLSLESAPSTKIDSSLRHFVLETEFTLPVILRASPLKIGINAVIEESDGTISYWALAHPAGKPDFHDPACFTYELKAAEQ